MKIHSLNCGSMCPHGRRFINGDGGVFARAEMVCHCWLIEAPQGLVLVDTGLGTRQVAGAVNPALKALLGPQLSPSETALAQVKQLGFSPSDVRDIVLTHLDFDHAGGLEDFPQARVHVHTPELEDALNPPTFMDRQRYESHLWAHGPQWVRHQPQGERWNGFDAVRALGDGDDEILLVPLAGHTRGHTGVAVRDEHGWRLHCGDAYFFHGEVSAEAACPPGLRLFQTLVARHNPTRRANQARLRELNLNPPGTLRLNSAHCPQEFSRDAA